ncbi:hypothetical protein EON64_18575 [archaeon]|nr:MAG: hypothetical protein EON64_18575 [archaeon]
MCATQHLQRDSQSSELHVRRLVKQEMQEVSRQAADMQDELASQSAAEQGFELLVQFIQDLLGRKTAAARIYAAKMELEFEKTRRVRVWIKAAIVMFLLGINGFFFYFTILRGISKGVAWQRSYATAWVVQCVLDVAVFETLQCSWFHYVVPSLASKEVQVAHELLHLAARCMLREDIGRAKGGATKTPTLNPTPSSSQPTLPSHPPPNLPILPPPSSSVRVGWLECEVLNIVGETECNALRSTTYDVRLGSVWMVRVAIKTPHYSSSVLSGGDLMLLQSPAWNKALLAVVQPWDPDYDKAITSMAPSLQQSFLSEATDPASLFTTNLLICVDGAENIGGREQIGGWASPGTVFPGVSFQMSRLGNVMTYVRECQALMSLKLLHPPLRDAVLNSEGRQETCYVTDSLPLDSLGPCNVPPKLWAALKNNFNPSQLRALRMVCRRNPVEDTPLSPICLLQGPPGTGEQISERS